ncbi:MAG: hypothetical protein ACD_38C00154G0008 [uncultured bacterium]|uniref:HD domain-containing protein n=1 Tax=Candidatus Daviesbacteria bacterium GW2011_GWC2_40_12 TaxID=1618431 RepID=A0A0G0T5J7_9BACT|nr:MAG: hypothetical protein ACD_38C00154G0008 [uncultured bacterium]KKQ85512.1 MAG: hypothetical protein UT04_C0003G0017 [Candidatus Daviesbacteria bacterium GW2011_GWF2_38_7]KKR16808.1 MAG: hypothetical protein UT45_C0004G0139 [Candidatus Daviesbacteria bacterium GW2011_GWA2_39_33]KKR24628.1 MAG: hypothetical protein UT54_C0015G0005 [Candidatus Daviesbacteria bacterium GW2011_GWB1_39_5]KKR42410.1 MAG: hypothetical protein UT77_C0002G0063 [Candidatus Daviesbacteria bacterium GW2011_GWC2_40_12]
MDLESTISKIIQNPLFLKLKSVVENNGYHNHEDAYSHSIKTKDIAQREITGEFITNPLAKDLFFKFINEDITGIKSADILILIALLHDIGKSLPGILKTDANVQTSCPGHEQKGSGLVPQLLQGLSLPDEVISYIAKVISFHDSFPASYFENKVDLNDVKSKSGGLYIEAMFNQYCDCFDAVPYKTAKIEIVNLFNNPEFYKEPKNAG